MADCEFCGSGVDVEAQDMGEGRVMMLCASCRANIAAGEERHARDEGETSAMAIFPTCDVAGCEKPAIVGPVTFAPQSYTSAINSWPGITYTTDVDRRYCYEHSPTTEAERLRAFVRTIADGRPQEDAPAHVTAIFIDSLRSEAQRLLAASSVAHPDANKG